MTPTLSTAEKETIKRAKWLDSQRYNFLDSDGTWKTRDEHLVKLVEPLLDIIDRLGGNSDG